jgi:hypothetical protein
MNKEEELYCHYSDLPSPSAYKEIIEIPLDNIMEIFISKNSVEIKYEDGTKHTIKDEVKIIRGLSNENDSPILDHCI